MSGRLPSGLLAAALVRRANDAGGLGVVRARGDAEGGGILVLASEADGPERVLERGIGPTGEPALIDATPAGDLEDYWRRRRARDPDLWVLALNVAQVERFVAETLLAN